MRLLAGQFLVPILVTLLALTTPVGTGQGVHENELLHPVWAHVHLVDGRIISDQQLAVSRAAAAPDRVTSRPPGGQAIGAGNGADAFGFGIGIGPTLPLLGLILPGAPESRLALSESNWPTEFRDPPLDPPPDPFA